MTAEQKKKLDEAAKELCSRYNTVVKSFISDNDLVDGPLNLPDTQANYSMVVNYLTGKLNQALLEEAAE
jgi:hypothetical protein